MLIGTPGGRMVPLKSVATVAIRPEPAAITHDDVLRDVEVAAKVTGDPGAAVDAVKQRLAAVPMPYEYHAGGVRERGHRPGLACCAPWATRRPRSSASSCCSRRRWRAGGGPG